MVSCSLQEININNHSKYEVCNDIFEMSSNQTDNVFKILRPPFIKSPPENLVKIISSQSETVLQ